MFKFFIFFIFICCFLPSTKAISSTFIVPDKFYVRERYLGWTTTFDIESEDFKLGSVQRKFWSFGLEYLYFDVLEQHQATAKMRFFSLGAVFDVQDIQEHKLGTVIEKIFHILSHIPNYFPWRRNSCRSHFKFLGK